MALPMIPGLLGGADFPGEEAPADGAGEAGSPVEQVTQLLDGADPADLSALIEEANAALEAGELDTMLDSPSGAPAPSDSDVENEDPTTDENGEGGPPLEEMDARTTSTVVASIVGEITGIESELTDLASAVDASESDLDIEEALSLIQEALTDAGEAQAEADAAIADEDLDAAKAAREKAEEALKKAQEAKESVKKEAVEAADKLEAESEPDPLLLWAKQHR